MNMFLKCALAVVIAASHAFAATAQVDWNRQLETDPAVVKGMLPNGITYYLRHNEEPKDRASFYIVRNAGALLEEDNQNGLAHFLEHMAFQGTKNFPGKGIIESLEKNGVSFGSNINAYTGHNETVYNISNVPVARESLLDTCLLVLHDWSYYLTLAEDEIDGERGVISEEWRTRRNSDFRIKGQIDPVLFKDSKYAVRDVIGSLDVIKNHTPRELRDFYHKWYRTDLEAVIVVGDFDMEKMESKVKQMFNSIPAVEHPAKRPFFAIPAHDDIRYVEATDPEAKGSTLTMYLVKEQPSAEEKQTAGYVRKEVMKQLFNLMASNRLRELTEDGGMSFLGATIGYGALVRGYDVYTVTATARGDNEAGAWEAILAENERICRYGFTADELERAKLTVASSLNQMGTRLDKLSNDLYAADMKNNFLEQTPMLAFTEYATTADQVLQTVTPNDIKAMVEAWNNGKNCTLAVTGETGKKHLTRDEMTAIMARVKTMQLEPYKDRLLDADLMDGVELKGGRIVSEKRIGKFDAVEWTLDNGVRVVFRTVSETTDAVNLMAYSEGGYSLYDDARMIPPAESLSNMANVFGVNRFSGTDLQRVLTGKTVSSGIVVNELQESVIGASLTADMETLFQLTYLRFAHPRFDERLLPVIIANNKEAVRQMAADPMRIMQDSTKLIRADYNPRGGLRNEAYLDAITMERLKQIHRERFGNAADFTFFIVGDVDEAAVRPLVERYLGSLPATGAAREHWVDRGVRPPKGRIEKRIGLALEVPKTTVVVNFEKEMKFTFERALCHQALCNILTARCMENIREKEGGTYGVSVNGLAQQMPCAAYKMNAQFSCDPERADRLKAQVYAEIDRVVNHGVSADELEKVVSAIRKQREEQPRSNVYWINVLRTYYYEHTDLTDPATFDDILDGLSPKDIRKYAREYFKHADVVDFMFTPLSD